MSLPSPAPGFDDPLGLLLACHERIIRYASLLAAVAEGRADPAISAPAIWRYFSTAGQHHHADEEEDLFPVLEDKRPGITAALVADHRRLDALWQALQDGWARPELLVTSMSHPAREFAALNLRHVALENAELLPLARVLMSPAELHKLGSAMAQRRGLSGAP